MSAEETKETMHEPHEHPHELIASNGIKDDESDEDASEAQAQVIASLRAQVTDLFSQVTQLNSKLVSSYDRVSDLEDQIHDASASLRNSSVTISSLELERSHHLAALNTGLLVEKAHVTAELNRLMERATEEAAQRGQAESARHDIEKDLDDLSATLFDQANNMVAEARLGRARSERKVLEAEEALKIAEDAVKVMQTQMQTLQAEKEAAEREVQEARVTVGKGKWVERDDLRLGDAPKVRFMTTHAPYAEFIAFVTHLRGLKTSQPTPPIISSLLGQPFLARLLTEDS
jgi:chromosome segregation ATPase